MFDVFFFFFFYTVYCAPATTSASSVRFCLFSLFIVYPETRLANLLNNDCHVNNGEINDEINWHANYFEIY